MLGQGLGKRQGHCRDSAVGHRICLKRISRDIRRDRRSFGMKSTISGQRSNASGEAKSTRMRNWAVGLPLVLGAAVLPTVVYNSVEGSSFAAIPGLQFAGGLIYPIGAIWLISHIDIRRTRLALLYLLAVITLGAGALFVPLHLWLALATFVAALIPMPFAIVYACHRRWRDAILWLGVGAIGIGIGVLVLYGTLLAIGQQSWSGLRY